MDTTSLGDRMKGYEGISKSFLMRRTPVIIRLDGKAFHTLTKKLNKPYDEDFKECMMKTAEYLVDNIMGCKFAYVQSDEISLLLIDYTKLETQSWYNNNIQKIVSVSASLATAKFNELYQLLIPNDKKITDLAFFDSRAFNVPREDVVNYFIWRQNDATRNSIQGLGQVHFSNKDMHGRNNNQVQDMLMLDKNINWNDVDTYFKRGGCVYKGIDYDDVATDGSYATIDGEFVKEYKFRYITVVNDDIPIFTKNRAYIQNHVDCDIESIVKLSAVDRASDILNGVIEDDGVHVSSSIQSIGYIIRDNDMYEKYTTQGAEE